VRNAAEGVAGNLNRQAAALQPLMLPLADSRLLQTSHRAAFHVQAIELVRRQNLTAVLYDTAGPQLMKRSVAFGADLPAERATISQVVQTGQAYIPDLFTDTGTGAPSVSSSIPARRNGMFAYVLSSTLAIYAA
jgi:hypothetical protein